MFLKLYGNIFRFSILSKMAELQRPHCDAFDRERLNRVLAKSLQFFLKKILKNSSEFLLLKNILLIHFWMNNNSSFFQ